MGTNLEIYKFIQNLRQLVNDALSNGCPIYAIELALKDVTTFDVDPLLKKTLNAESEKEQNEAVPIGEPWIGDDNPNVVPIASEEV